MGGGGAIYADFVLAAVAREDPTRAVWPSSPGDGWASGVDALYGLPNGRRLVSSIRRGTISSGNPTRSDTHPSGRQVCLELHLRVSYKA